jgi:7-carboxy-7-deazaguanine synthase
MIDADGALMINEMFGPTIQGEGVSLGRPAMFLRLAYCNLQCTYCDTPYSWDWKRFDRAEEAHRTPIAEVAERVVEACGPSVRLLVISGGEPMLQQPGITGLLDRLGELAPQLEVEIETNGTVAPTDAVAARVSRFNVSPKLSSAGMSDRRRIRPDAIGALRATNKASWKFVISNTADVSQVQAFVERFRVSPVFLMPEGTTAGQLAAKYELVTDACIRHGWNMTPRLHIVIWGDTRAV